LDKNQNEDSSKSSRVSNETYGGSHSAYALEGGKCIELHGASRSQFDAFMAQHPRATTWQLHR
jgi:hypothetical protein